MNRSFHSIIPDADELLSLEPEELAVAVLEFLKASDSQVLNRYNFGLYHTVAEYPRNRQAEILRALMEAWAWLESAGFIASDPEQTGDWVFITRKGRKIKDRADFESFKNSASLSKHLLHPIIVQKSWPPFIRGEYETSVFQAFREVEIRIREASGFGPGDIGTDLMRKAFAVEEGPLTDKTSVRGERQALSDLIAGAIGRYKNPSSHRQVDLKVAETSELLMLASHLLRIVDSRSEAKK